MKNKKGFTLIELLAVIVILGLLIAIAIPSITRYITQSRKKTLATTISKYVDSGLVSVNNGEYIFNDSNVIYAIPIECIPMERGGDNPFGEWNQVNDEYWAYVLVQYNPDDFSYKYGFTFKDSAGYGMHPVSLEDMDVKGKDILTNLELAQPRTGLASNFSTVDYWKKSGFNVNDETRVKVLQSRLEGESGDGQNTCTLHNKGLNYEEIEEIRSRSGILINSGSDINLVFGKEMDRNLIEEIYTRDYIDIPTDAIDSWDASIQKNSSIMAYITDKDKDNLYELYLAQENGVIAPSISTSLFYNYSSVISMDLKKLDTSNVTNMSAMFNSCKTLTKLDLSSFDTSNVTDMTGMFQNISLLMELNLSSFDTSNVTVMKHMFDGARSLNNLDLSSFNTSNVWNMWYMFSHAGYNNKKFKLNLGNNFDTSRVTNMGGMFSHTGHFSEVFELNLGNYFDTSRVTNMGGMFSYVGYSNPNFTLDLGDNFDTLNVTSMASMFSNVGYSSKNFTLNLGNDFNTSNVTNMSYMFYLTGNSSPSFQLDLGDKFYINNVTNMEATFFGNKTGVLKLNASSFNSNVLFSNTFTYFKGTVYVKTDTDKKFLDAKYNGSVTVIVK